MFGRPHAPRTAAVSLSTTSRSRGTGAAYIVMAYALMAYVVMACIVMAHIARAAQAHSCRLPMLVFLFNEGRSKQNRNVAVASSKSGYISACAQRGQAYIVMANKVMAGCSGDRPI